MHGLLDDPRQAQAIGEAGRRSALKRFGIERFVADWDAALREVTR
jgi:hypothetical protein